MEDIKVGEYVRTRQGRITRLIKIAFHNVVIGHGLQEYQPYCKFENSYCICADNEDELYKKINKYITKHSFNLIDLIEIGDIVNKSEIYEIGESEDGQKWIHTCTGKLYYEEELKKASILTHEQYKAECYKML